MWLIYHNTINNLPRLKPVAFQHSKLEKPLSNLVLHCAEWRDTAEHYHCNKAHLSVAGVFKTAKRQLSVLYDKRSGNVRVKLKKWSIAAGLIDLDMKWIAASQRWQLNGQLNNINLELLHTVLTPWLKALKDSSLMGLISGKFALSGGDNGIEKLRLQLDSQDLGLGNAAGTVVGEQLNLGLNIDLQQIARTWQGTGELTISQGEIFIDPFYNALQSGKIKLDCALTWLGDVQRLKMQSCQYSHPDVVEFQAALELEMTESALKWHQFNINIPRFELADLREHYLKTYLDDIELAKLALRGRIQLVAEWTPEKGKLSATLQGIDVLNTDKGTGILGLNGALNWHSDPAQAQDSLLRWSGLQFFNTLKIPAGQMLLNWQGNDLKLLTPVHLPILDGALRIKELELLNMGSDDLHIDLLTQTEAMSMKALSEALAWPTLGGRISGVIPKIHYSNQKLSIDGAIQIDVFGGSIVVHHLTANNLFGSLPILNANIDVKRLDLQTLTRFFEFGEIEGKLSGKVKDLRLYKWQPVSFIAAFSTPEHNAGRRRISQKAVNNLSNLGGSGVTDALSKRVLSLFESFAYDKLGWSCVLNKGICQMGGVGKAIPFKNPFAPAPNPNYVAAIGYYLHC